MALWARQAAEGQLEELSLAVEAERAEGWARGEALREAEARYRQLEKEVLRVGAALAAEQAEHTGHLEVWAWQGEGGVVAANGTL